uniref:PhoD-like phosphatase metallophosphatase domain-containing protein n=1 Tax=Kalanchoe fedtschenkoi TaxID=63787 RepID=A0A7N0UHD9_KALFE
MELRAEAAAARSLVAVTGVSLALLILLLSASASTSREEECMVSRIAFGSCANQSAPQPIWDAVNEFNPQLFIWLGDNIYGDNKRPFRVFGKERTIGPWKNVPRFVPATEQEMVSKYEKAKSNPGYIRLRKSAKVIGTWDDHDYGINDAGKEFEGKIVNQRLMLDFLDEPPDSPRRKQAGVYASYTFGPIGKQIKVILLDTRYHRDPMQSDGTVLGDEQWKWLEKELNGPPTALTVIGSSVQVVSNLSATMVPLFATEGWGRFPTERKRLFKAINDSKRDGVVFISGDVHFGEISRYDCATGYPLYDITASGITQAVEKATPRPFHLLLRFLAWMTPTTMRVKNQNCRFKSCTYAQPNFGVIEIDWNVNPATLTLQIRDVKGSPAASVKTLLSELHSNSVTKPDKSGRHCQLESDLPWLVRHRLAIFVLSSLAALLVAIVGLIVVAVVFTRRCIRKCKYD